MSPTASAASYLAHTDMGKAGKVSLKSALHAQQTRFERKQKASQAAQVAEQKSKKKRKVNAKVKTNGDVHGGHPPAEQQTMPFRPTDRALLVGEGNFSFARALVRLHQHEASGGRVFMPPTNITATAYDSEKDCYAKYPDARAIVDEVRKNGVEVLFSIDATRLDKVAALRGRKFDKVMWNFPHAGKGITDQDRNILSNQLLILAFLRSAASILATGPIPEAVKRQKKKKSDSDDDEEGSDKPDGSLSSSLPVRGTVLITLRNVPPYTQWNVSQLAKKPPPPTTVGTPINPCYIQLRSFAFIRSAWPEYEHRMTKGERAHGTGTTGEGGEDRTWEFCLRNP